jgi:hypothetical protein
VRRAGKDQQVPDGHCCAVPVLEALGTAVCYAIGPVIAAQQLAGADAVCVTAAALTLRPSGTPRRPR